LDQSKVVTADLSSEAIEQGASVVRRLDEVGLQVASAFWLFLPGQGHWRLVLAIQDVEAAGPRSTYAKIQETLSSNPQSSIPLSHVMLVKPEIPIVKALRKAVPTDATSVASIRFTNNAIDGLLITDALIYRSS
jgi:hypothetical protein